MREKSVFRLSSLLLWIGVFAAPLVQTAVPPSQQAPEGTPTRAIQELDNMLDAYILHPKDEEEKKFNAEMKKKILHGTFDIAHLCQLALSQHWDDLNRKERDKFIDLMTRLLEKKAIFSKEHANGKGSSKAPYSVSYEGESFLNEPKSIARVRTAIQIPSEQLTITVHYKLTRADSSWRIFDVIVDDASLVDNYRYQFDRIISQHGYEDLVHRMESKLRELEQKEGGPPGLITETSPPPPKPAKPEKKGGCTLEK
ncbi:MAG: ABC transporter substrate-binding protein [Deltaproteobacteria bacterium]|nr:ABC transporter substrate-binding protein [Deltaproteobacteria bacterium]